MRALILRTGHEIADKIADSLSIGLGVAPVLASQVTIENVADADFVIGYGILRGTADVYGMAEAIGKPWFVVDKGYFHPEHYNGYYRLGYRGTQGPYQERYCQPALMADKLETNRSCGIICPPTPDVCEFFGIDAQAWLNNAIDFVASTGKHFLVREKTTNRKLSEDLAQSAFVYTFNSSVAWQAIALGIPAISDPHRSVVGQWQAGREDRKLGLTDIEASGLVTWLLDDQFKLIDIERGYLWDKIKKCAFS
jgi:hypothetical protein